MIWSYHPSDPHGTDTMASHVHTESLLVLTVLVLHTLHTCTTVDNVYTTREADALNEVGSNQLSFDLSISATWHIDSKYV